MVADTDDDRWSCFISSDLFVFGGIICLYKGNALRTVCLTYSMKRRIPLKAMYEEYAIIEAIL